MLNPITIDQIELKKVVGIILKDSFFDITANYCLDKGLLEPNTAREQLSINDKIINQIKQSDTEFKFHKILSPKFETLDFLKRVSKFDFLDKSNLGLLLCCYYSILDFHSNFNFDLSIFNKKIKDDFQIALKLFWEVYDQDFGIIPSNYSEIGRLALEASNLYLEIKRMTADYTDHLKDFGIFNPIITDRNERLTILIPADKYRSDMGRIVDHSNTGSSVYIQPLITINKQNELNKILDNLKILEITFLSKLFSSLKIHSNIIEQFPIMLQNIDLYLTSSIYFLRNEYCRPIISYEDGIFFELVNFYHPLISDPVKNSIHIKKDDRLSLITGVNAGGKSVLLKTLTLFQILSQMGFFVPADNAKIGVSSKIFYFHPGAHEITSGDSSFSFEARQYLNFLNRDFDNYCVFIDEIFNTTNSEEASALAIAIVENILKKTRHTKLFITTHHQTLKDHFSKEKSNRFFGFSFSSSEGRSNFKILEGRIENSNALVVFKLLEREILDASIVSNSAVSRLGEQKESIFRKLDSVHEREMNLDARETTFSDKERALNDQIENFREQKNKYLIQIEMETSQIKADYLKRAEEILSSVKSGSIKNLSTISKALVPEKLPSSNNRPKLVLKAGKEYFLNSLQTFAVLNDFDEARGVGTALVKGKKIKINLKDLSKEKTSSLTPSNNKSDTKAEFNFFFTSNDDEFESQIEFDVRGKRIADLEELFYKGLTLLRLNRSPYIKFIHGHGDGILKNWLRTHLQSYEDLECELEEGNDGITVIRLKSN